MYSKLGNREGMDELPLTGSQEIRPLSKPTDLVQGTLDLLLLKILALEALNGWAISQRLKEISGEILQVLSLIHI